MRLRKDWLSYPVFIEVAGTHGSGFFVNDDNWIYLVSAKHVLFKGSTETYDAHNGGPVKLICLPPSTGDNPSTANIIELDCLCLVAEGNMLKHQIADVAVCRLARLGNNVIAPDGRLSIKFCSGVSTNYGQLTGVPLSDTLRLDNVAPGAAITMFGYPTSLAGEFFSKDTSLLRSGIVAGKTKSGEIVIDCPVYFGNSGALVLETEPGSHARAVGVATRMAVNAVLSLDALVGIIHADLIQRGCEVEQEDDKFRDALAARHSEYHLLRDIAATFKHGELRHRKPRLVRRIDQLKTYSNLWDQAVWDRSAFDTETVWIEPSDPALVKRADEIARAVLTILHDLCYQ